MDSLRDHPAMLGKWFGDSAAGARMHPALMEKKAKQGEESERSSTSQQSAERKVALLEKIFAEFNATTRDKSFEFYRSLNHKYQRVIQKNVDAINACDVEG